MAYTDESRNAGGPSMTFVARLLLPAGLLLAAVAGAAQAADPVPAWFDATASNESNAEAARRANENAGVAATTLIRYGGEPVDSVRSVVRAYNTCPALYDAVRAGVSAAPKQGTGIAAAVAALESCPCTGENLWARSRVDNRLRNQRGENPFELSFACACSAATAEAVASAVPELASAVYRTLALSESSCQCATSAFAGTVNGLGDGSKEWIEQERQRAEEARGNASGPSIVDAVGQIHPGDKKAGLIEADASSWVRRADVCAQRTDPFSEFKVGKEFNRAPGAPDYRTECRSDVQNVLISRFVQMSDGARAVELSNLTKEPIELGAEGLRLEIYGDNERDPKQVVPLTGQIEASGLFLVATPNAPGAMRDRADMVTPDLYTPRTDAVLLRRLGSEDDAACPADVLAIVRQYPEGPITIVPPDVATLEGRPRTDESVIDPNRGGEIASPN